MTSSRIPNLLHVFCFLGVTFFSFLVSAAFFILLTHSNRTAAVFLNPKLDRVSSGAYLSAGIERRVVCLSFPMAATFPATGVRWNAAKARPSLLRSWDSPSDFAAQGLTVFIPHPKDLPIEELLRNPALIWLFAFFALRRHGLPLFEEIVFRGFLLPAIAIAVDYMRIPRDSDPLLASENLFAWRASSAFSTTALVVSSIVTSVLFALIHGPQLGYTWAAVGLLASVSIVLCIVRIRTGSVAASTLVHACYNLSVFLTLFVASGGFRHLDRIK